MCSKPKRYEAGALIKLNIKATPAPTEEEGKEYKRQVAQSREYQGESMLEKAVRLREEKKTVVFNTRTGEIKETLVEFVKSEEEEILVASAASETYGPSQKTVDLEDFAIVQGNDEKGYAITNYKTIQIIIPSYFSGEKYKEALAHEQSVIKFAIDAAGYGKWTGSNQKTSLTAYEKAAAEVNAYTEDYRAGRTTSFNLEYYNSQKSELIKGYNSAVAKGYKERADYIWQKVSFLSNYELEKAKSPSQKTQELLSQTQNVLVSEALAKQNWGYYSEQKYETWKNHYGYESSIIHSEDRLRWAYINSPEFNQFFAFHDSKITGVSSAEAFRNKVYTHYYNTRETLQKAKETITNTLVSAPEFAKGLYNGIKKELEGIAGLLDPETYEALISFVLKLGTAILENGTSVLEDIKDELVSVLGSEFLASIDAALTRLVDATTPDTTGEATGQLAMAFIPMAKITKGEKVTELLGNMEKGVDRGIAKKSGGSGSSKNLTQTSQTLGSVKNVTAEAIQDLLELSRAKGGHAVSKHVDWTDQEFKDHIQKQIDSGIPIEKIVPQAKFKKGALEKSLLEVFKTPEGQKLIGDTLKASREKSFNRDFSLVFETNRNIGKAFVANKSKLIDEVEGLSKIKIVLKPNGQGGFYLITSYPTLKY